MQRREAAEAYDTERKAMNEELRRALDALRASESAFRAAFEQVAVGMNQVSLDGRFLQVNQRYCEITGYSREELMQLRFTDITHPEDRAADVDRAAPIVRGDVPNDRWEKRYVRKDGSIIWAAITASLMRSPSGEPVYLLAVVENVTARVLAEEALRQSEERFRQVVEHAPDAIMVETELRLRYMNPAAARLFGAESTQQLTGSSVLDRVQPEDWAGVRERSATVLAGQPVPETEQHYVRLSGETFPAEVSATPIVYDGQPAALVFFRDATDRKRAAEERVRLEQRLAPGAENGKRRASRGRRRSRFQ